MAGERARDLDAELASRLRGLRWLSAVERGDDSTAQYLEDEAVRAQALPKAARAVSDSGITTNQGGAVLLLGIQQADLTERYPEQ